MLLLSPALMQEILFPQDGFHQHQVEHAFERLGFPMLISRDGFAIGIQSAEYSSGERTTPDGLDKGKISGEAGMSLHFTELKPALRFIV